ncbi:MAG: DUF624 domain-containing protein [Ruminococcaceae bacterium]|nr:DUF624 domain-containing protein [Oscillospiraceae bacterium]
MAGFFGLFDYSKEGPGVSKNEPQKHRFFLFFDVYFRKFWKICILSMLYVVSCIPIVTIGAATAGFTYVLRNYAREEHAFLWSDYIDTAKKNWKMATVVFLIDIVAFILGFVAFSFYTSPDVALPGMLKTIALGLLLMVSIIYTFMHYYIYVLLVTFNVTFRQLYKNSFIFAIVGLWRNILITIILAILGLAIFLFFPLSIFVVFFVLAGTMGFIINFTVYPLIKKLMIDPILAQEEKKDVEDDEAIFDDERKIGNNDE